METCNLIMQDSMTKLIKLCSIAMFFSNYFIKKVLVFFFLFQYGLL